ncbi:MAG: histidine--tRNA ligase [Candidatus Micrarchaeia archaeon]
MADLPFPRGVKDLMPNEAIFRNEALKRMERVAQRFGFTTIDTPSFEPLKLLYAKNAIGEDTKLIYELKNEDLGLRYDNTISLARYVSMHKELPLPLKRYYIGKVWRREEPQHLRYREFTQVDADIVGGSETSADAEVIALAGAIMSELDIAHTIKINDRRVMDIVLSKLGLGEEKHINAMRAMDKIEKIGAPEVAKLLLGIGMEEDNVDSLIDFISAKGDNGDKLDYASGFIGDRAPLSKMESTIDALSTYGLKSSVDIDFSLMRGFDYYTGIVFELKVNDINESVCGGGRYDNLIGLYGGKSMPAVGFAIGVDRLLDYMGYSSSMQATYAKAFVAYVSKTNYMYATKVANALRKAGIPTDLNTSEKNLSNQLKYASSMKIQYVAIVGDSEENKGVVRLRSLTSGEEQELSIDDATNTIKKGLR